MPPIVLPAIIPPFPLFDLLVANSFPRRVVPGTGVGSKTQVAVEETV